MWTDLRRAVRMLRRTPGFAIATIATLALGIAATTAVYSVVDAVLLKPLPFDRPDRVVQVAIASRDGQFGLSGGAVAALERLPIVEHVAVMLESDRALYDGANPEQLHGGIVSGRFFAVFGIPPIAGRVFTDAIASDVPPVVLSERVWRRRFGADPSAIGRIVHLEDKPHVIVAVMPGRFAVPEGADFWLSYRVDAADLAVVGPGPFNVVARLRSGDLRTASAQAEALSAALPELSRQQQRFVLMSMLELIGGPYRGLLTLLLAAAGMVLLIACGNAANLFLTQTRRRARELAVRCAVGATRGRIVRQLVTEAAVVAAIAAAAGVSMAAVMLRVIGMTELPRAGEIAVNGRVAVFSVAMSAVTVCLFGLIPAWLSLRRGVAMMPARQMTDRGSRRTSRVLVAAEIAVALTLCVGSALTTRSVWRLVNVDPGFETRQLTIATIRPALSKYQALERTRFHERVLDRLRRHPGVESAAAISHLPLDRRLPPRATVSTTGAGDAARRSEARMRLLTPGALGVLGVALVRGREFTAGDGDGAPPVAIVNQRLAAALWPDRDPVGQLLTLSGGRGRTAIVVGVAGNLRGNLRRPPDPEVYVSAGQQSPLDMSIVVRSPEQPRAVEDALREAVRLEDPQQAIARIASLRDVAASATAYQRASTIVLTLFGACAVLLTASGILAVVMFAVATRAREFAIRMALGARRGQVIRLVVGEMTLPVAAGMATGLVLVYNLSFLLARRGLLFEVREFDAALYGAAALAITAIAMIAAWLPARRAAQQSPVVALTQE